MSGKMHSSRKRIAALALCAACSASVASATTQTSTWTDSAGDSNWLTATNWSPTGVPNNGQNGVSDYSVVVGAPSPTELGISVTVDNLAVGTSGQVNLNAANKTLSVEDDLSNSGNFSVTASGANLTTSGTLSNSATLTISGASATVNQSGIFTNGGVVNVSGGSEPTFYADGTVVNTGTIDTGGNGPLFDSIGSVANDGTLIAGANYGRFLIEAGFANLSGGTLTGGTYEVFSENTMTFPGQVQTNAAAIVLSGSAPNFTSIASLDTNSGSFTLQAGAPFTTAAAFTNTGTVTIGPAVDANGPANLTVNGNYNQSAGVTQVDGVLTLVSPAALNLSGGTLKGAGTIVGNVVNTGGTVSPGDAPGTLMVAGNYSQNSFGALAIAVAGSSSGGDFSSLQVSGTVTLAGTLNLALNGGYDPATGDTYTILTAAGGVTGTFGTVNSAVPVEVTYGQDDVMVTILPEPSSLSLLALATLLPRRRKKVSR